MAYLDWNLEIRTLIIIWIQCFIVFAVGVIEFDNNKFSKEISLGIFFKICLFGIKWKLKTKRKDICLKQKKESEL